MGKGTVVSAVALLAEFPEQTNKSVEELVNHCYASGQILLSIRRILHGAR